MAKVFYARVSTIEQNEARQMTAAQEQGADEVFLDKLSGKDTNRPQLKAMLAYIRKGDTVVVESISRLARSTKDLLTIVEQITAKGAAFVSMKEEIDTHSPQGKFMLTVFAAMAELEREQIKQRQAEGIAIRKAQGGYKGRQPITVDEAKLKSECAKWRRGEQTAKATMTKLGLKPNTFYRRVTELGL